MQVPDNKIAIIPIIGDPNLEPFDINDLSEIIVPARDYKKRDWFDKQFYKCLPLAIGNMQGFLVSLPFDFSVYWTGGTEREDLVFMFDEKEKEYNHKKHVGIMSHFGHGIISLGLPFMMRTPPGVNLMTISPPNFMTYGLNTMTGVVEADNLRYHFSINIKVNVMNEWVTVRSGHPLAGIIPVPRYFCDSFELSPADVLMGKDWQKEEQEICYENEYVRNYLRFNNINEGLDRSYYKGEDIRGNKFQDHQLPYAVKDKDEDRTNN